MATRNARKRKELRPTIMPDRGPTDKNENADWIKHAGHDIMTPDPKITPGSSGYDPVAVMKAKLAEEKNPSKKPKPTPKYSLKKSN